MNSRIFTFALLLLFLPGSKALAQAPSAADVNALKAEIEALKQDYERRIQELEAKVSAIQASPSAREPQSQQAAAQSPSGAESAGRQTEASVSSGVTGSTVSGAKVFNPDIAVIGDFLAAAGSNKFDPSPALEMHESEASFQAILDPYARADFYMAFGEEGVDLEEGFITFPAIPGGLLLRAGKMRAAFGKVNTQHNHMLSWTDRPLVTKNLVGGEEGISDAGFSIARLIPNPWIFLEATGQVFRGDSAALFKTSRRSDLSYVGHLRGYQDISDNTNIDLGFSFSQGHNASGIVNDLDLGRFRTTLYGGDATIRWKPLNRSVYHSFVGRSEFIWSRRNQPNGLQSGKGFYVSGDYQLARRWFTGLRYDRSNHSDDVSLHDTGQSLTLTYWPSEFSQVRGQYRRTKYAAGLTANEFLMQFQFSIGAHGAHPF